MIISYDEESVSECALNRCQSFTQSVNGVKVHLLTSPKLKLPHQCAEAGCSVAMVMMLMTDGVFAGLCREKNPSH